MNIPPLKMVGYWSQVEDEDRYIWPQELVQDKPIEDADKIAKYLQDGIPAIHWKGYSGCRICRVSLGTKCLTDGTWIWPEKLEHYVLEHNVRLPEDFVNHMKECAWTIIHFRINEKTEIKIEETKTDRFWKYWCKCNHNLDLVPVFIEYPVPTKTGKNELDLHLIHDLFLATESEDILVTRLTVDTKETLSSIPGIEKVIDWGNKNESDHLWSAEIVYGKPLIAAGDENGVGSALVFKKKKPIIYCAFKRGVWALGEDRTKYCPKLIGRSDLMKEE